MQHFSTQSEWKPLQESTSRLLRLQQVQARSIPTPEERGRTRILTLGNGPGLIQQRPTATRHAETVEERREGGWSRRAAVISSFFFFSTYRLYTTSRRFALWKHACRFEPIAAGLFGEQPINRAGRCSVGVSSGVHRGARRSWDGSRGGPVGLPSLATPMKPFISTKDETLSFAFFHFLILIFSWVLLLKFTNFGSLYKPKFSLKKEKQFI